MSRNNGKKVETIATVDPVEVTYEFYDSDPVEETIADPINDLLAVAPFVEIEGIPVTFSRGHFRVKGIPFAFYKDQEVILLETDSNVLASVQDLTFPKLGLSLRKWIESHSVTELISLGIVSQNDRQKAIDAQKTLLKDKADLRSFKKTIAPPKPELTLEQRLRKEQEMLDKKIAKRANARALLSGL